MDVSDESRIHGGLNMKEPAYAIIKGLSPGLKRFSGLCYENKTLLIKSLSQDKELALKVKPQRIQEFSPSKNVASNPASTALQP